MASTEPQDQPIVAAFSPHSARREPVEFANAASHLTGAPLVVVTIRPGGPMVGRLGGDVDDYPGDDGQAIEHLREGMRRRGLRHPDVRVIQARTIKGGLSQVLKDLRPQLVVFGTNRRGTVGSALLGTTVEHVIHEAVCPVAVVPDGYARPEEGVKLIGAAYCATDEGREALHAAAALSRARPGVRVRAIAVLDPDHAAEQSHGLLAEQHHDASPGEGTNAAARLGEAAQVRQAVAALGDGVDAEADILYNDPAEGLIAASRHVDLLIMGSRAHGARRSVVLGSVSRKVVERAACPVVVIPRGATQTTEALLQHAVDHAPG